VLVPVVVVAWGAWKRIAIAVALALVSFALTSPYAVLHAGRAWDDVREVSRLARRGWLGFENDPPAFVAFGERLWDAMGPALLIGIAGLVVALFVRSRADIALATFALVWYAQLLPLHAHFDRYTLPLVPVLGALAGRLRALAPVTLLLLLVPLTWSVRDAVALTKKDTRVAARDWIVTNVPRDAKLAADPSTADLPGYDVLPLALPGPGRAFDPHRDVVRLRLDGVRYVVLTGAVEDRVARAREHYPREARFSEQLADEADPVYTTPPGDGLSGPWVAVYRIAG
jgi:hypothetical protein